MTVRTNSQTTEQSTQRKGSAVSAEKNVETIKLIYEAFRRGDVPTILAHVTDDVDWASEASTKGAPWYGGHHGVGVQVIPQ
jgi:ketosteroid isomerase-like protein